MYFRSCIFFALNGCTYACFSNIIGLSKIVFFFASALQLLTLFLFPLLPFLCLDDHKKSESEDEGNMFDVQINVYTVDSCFLFFTVPGEHSADAPAL